MNSIYLRKIISGLQRDIAEEIAQISPDVHIEAFFARMNRDYIFKLAGISQPDVMMLKKIFAEMDIDYVAGKMNESYQVVFSCASEKLCHKLLLKLKEKSPAVYFHFNQLLKNTEADNYAIESNGKSLSLDQPRIMGILNLTPDSFFDGGAFLAPEKALHQAEKMDADGADIFDLGAESTRPGAKKVSLEDEWQRIKPVLAKLRKKTDKMISVDTYKAEIARRSIAEGADIINDISAMTLDPDMKNVIAQNEIALIMMHMQGTPENMQANPSYENVMEEIYLFLHKQLECAKASGIKSVIIDPGIGFGKTMAHNYVIIRRLAEFKGLGVPVLMGLSRKSFLNLSGNIPPQDRGIGTEVMHMVSLLNAADIIRVHDVRAAKYCIELVNKYIEA